MWSASASESSGVIGPDLAADAAEVVEQARPLARELGEQRWRAGARPPRRVLFSGGRASRSVFVRAGVGARLALDAASLAFAAFAARAGSSVPAAAGRRALRGASRRAARLPARDSELAPLVLSDGAQRRPGPRDDAPLLRVGERLRRFDVEQRLDPRRRLLCVLTAGAARARDSQLDLRDGAGRSASPE